MEAPRSPYVEAPWHTYINADILLLILRNSIFHPFIAWLIPLCLRALATSLHHPAMHLAICYAALVSLYTVLSMLNDRIAHGAPRPIHLEDEVIVITGGASGLGLLLAEVYGMRGVSVAVLDVRKIDGEARGVAFYECDVGDRAQVERVARRVEQDLGTPTILINNAGIAQGKMLIDLSAEEVDQTIRTNLSSHFHTLQTFLPGMLRSKTGGTIVTVSSVLAHIGVSRLTDYCATKAAVSALHASLSAELAQEPRARMMRTILVTTGQLSTPLFDGVRTPSSFLAPVVAPVEVVRQVVSLLDGGYGGEVRAPAYANAIGLWGILPGGARNILRRLSGIDKAMVSFKGRMGKSE